MLNHREYFGICLLICCVVFATAVWSEQPKNTVKNINPSPEILGVMIPEIQQQFMNGLAEYAAKYQASPIVTLNSGAVLFSVAFSGGTIASSISK